MKPAQNYFEDNYMVIIDMAAEQKSAMLLELEKLRSVAYQKIKLLKV